MRAFACVLSLAALLALAANGSAEWPPCDEEIVLTTPPGTIEIVHNNVEYNCCAWIDIQIAQQPFTIDFYEWELFTIGPCFCLCCFDLEMAVGGLVPGDYTVRLWKVYYEVPPQLAGEWVVTVEGFSEPFVRTTYLPCGETGTPEDETATWGVIKALYR
jgi:hypothetical protein